MDEDKENKAAYEGNKRRTLLWLRPQDGREITRATKQRDVRVPTSSPRVYPSGGDVFRAR
ncbi:hypothetical protein INR49_010156 [Caranx melampygus]|nr:hypothetical protein INR49_010156 [Caranx melampygus]